jgi:4-hydroxybenzoate polyprenyltransferase
MRVDHWVKNLLILPGVFFALATLEEKNKVGGIPFFVLGIFGACLASSANYVMNEYVDRDSDAFHPKKKLRPAALNRVHLGPVLFLYLSLVIASLLISSILGPLFFGTMSLYLFMAVIYNIKPIRMKDIRYLDVIVESINNPIRLTFGWTLVQDRTLPPPSLLIAFWCLGGFLMGAKRLSEFLELNKTLSKDQIIGYRKSLGNYTEKSLTRLVLLNGLLTVMFLTIFAIKYRPEYLIMVIVILSWIVVFFEKVSLSHSIAQAPEKLIGDKSTRVFIGLIIVSYLVSQFIEIPLLQTVVDSKILEVSTLSELINPGD